MSTLQDALEQYRQGTLTFEALDHAARQTALAGAQAAHDGLRILDADFQAGRLPAQLYFALKAHFGDETQMTGDKTQVMPVPDAPDKTRIAARPQMDDDGRTRITVSRPAVAETLPRTENSVMTPTTLIELASTETPGGHNLVVGDVLKDRFELKEVLGAGGMGQVFKALDRRKVEANDKEPYVALKVLNQEFRGNPLSLIALQREAKRAQTLSHPNIITVYDFDRDGARVFMSMAYLQGHPLNQLIRDLREHGLPFKQAWHVIEGMGAALAYAHKKNIVHSDFKPGNVFLDEQNEVKVLDFGIACAAGRHDKDSDDATVFDARSLGALTPAYASLEMLRSLEPDPRDDIYALACVTYELLTGKHPYGKLSAEKALELNVQPQPVPGLGRRRWRELQRALALKRENRTPSVDEFLKGLQPRSPLFYGAWAAGVVALIATGGNVYLNLTQPVNEAPQVTMTLTAEQKQKINDLLELADIHYEVGYLVAPTGSNALWAYQEVLKIDPYNEKAINGIKKIADALEQSAWEFYEKGNRSESMKKVMEGLEANPKHQGLMKLKGKLQG